VIATFAYQAANRDELLPRKPLPPVAPAAPELKGVKKGDATKPPHKPAEAAPSAH